MFDFLTFVLFFGVFYHGTRFIPILKYIVLSGMRGDKRGDALLVGTIFSTLV